MFPDPASQGLARRVLQALDIVSRLINERDVIFSTTGMTSRELYSQNDRPQNFYVLGSMGCALPIGIGLACSQRNDVIVLDGDGSALMSLGALALSKFLSLKNLRHYILDNCVYDSTGGQPTCSPGTPFAAIGHNITVIKVDPGSDPETPRIPFTAAESYRPFVLAVTSEPGARIYP